MRLKNHRQVWEQKSVWLFCCFRFKRNYDVSKSKSPCFLLNKDINFKKTKRNQKWKTPLRSSYVRRNLLHNRHGCLMWSQKKKISYRRLKTHKHLVSLFCCDFSFYEHSIGNLLMQLFIFNAVMCLSKNILYQYFVPFAPSLKTFYSHYAAPKTIKKI